VSSPGRTVLRPRALIFLYRRRLRAHAVQELFAGAGVAVAVALIFAVLVAASSIKGATSEVVHTVVGPASLQLRARSDQGLDERLLRTVEQLPGVKQAAPLLEQPATVTAPNGRHITVDLAGADVSLTVLDGLAHTLPIAVVSQHGVGLTLASARALGITRRDVNASSPRQVQLRVRGQTFRVGVTAVLGAEAVGALSQAVVAVMPLGQLQRLAGLPGRVSRVLVEPEPGHRSQVRSELRRIAAGRLTVAPGDQDLTLLREALRPNNLATGLFASIAGLLGVLLAANAMLLTIPDRRQAIADLRLAGARRSAIVQMVLSQALFLGLAASAVGVAGGYSLSRGALRPSTGYLAQAFALGDHTSIGVGAVLIAVLGGVMAIGLASGVLLLDLRRGRELDAVYLADGAPGNALEAPVQRRLSIGSLSLLVIATVAFVLAPQLALTSTAALAIATVLAVPLVLALTLRIASGLARQVQRLALLTVAVTSLKGTTLRSLALAATGGLALFGAVALGGAREDLLSGLRGFAGTYTSAADLWVLNQGDPLAVSSFGADHYATRISRLDGVASVEPMQSEYLDVGQRRAWLTARQPSGTRRLLEEQIAEGNPHVALQRLQGSGWIVVSQQLAAEQHTKVGDTLLLPTPTGKAPLRVAATTTNFGWSPGAILMSSREHERLWGASAPSALGIHLDRGASPAQVRRSVAVALGASSGLEVVTADERADRFLAIAREGLGQLADISLLLTVAAIIAMAAALGSAVWQRRPALAAMRITGASPRRLRKVLAGEAALMLAAGCLTGVLGGLYGQAVIDGYLKHVTGFPVASITASWQPLELLGIVVLLVGVLVAWPVISASKVGAEIALDE
jgi:putative ABC transport system permease protein